MPFKILGIGYDCSSFTGSVYDAAGIEIAGTADTQYNQFKSKNSFFNEKSKLKPGDLVFFDYNKDGKVDHVAIYTDTDKNGNIEFTHMTYHGYDEENQNSKTGLSHCPTYGQAILGYGTTNSDTSSDSTNNNVDNNDDVPEEDIIDIIDSTGD